MPNTRLILESAAVLSIIGLSIVVGYQAWRLSMQESIIGNLKESISENPLIHNATELFIHDKIEAVKNRLSIVITDPRCQNPNRTCEIYEWRNQDSDEYNQTTVDYSAYQYGKGTAGDIEANIEIYNVANDTYVSTERFIVEISRNGWYQTEIYVDGQPRYTFPAVTQSDVVQPGYISFEVYQP